MAKGFGNENEVPFNFAMMYYEELHNLRKMKSAAFIMGDVFAYRDCLEEILTTISFKLTKKETAEVVEILNAAERMLQSGSSLCKGKLREADLKLIWFMDKYKMIFPGAKRTGLNLIEKKYNLEEKK